MSKCDICDDTGIEEYYHDAGDHFGAGTAPGSGWRTCYCECTKGKKLKKEGKIRVTNP